MSRSLPFIVLAVGSLSCGDAPPIGPTIDGGWKGTYECGADSKKASAIFDEDAEGVVSGEAFLDYQVVILGTPILLTGRGEATGAREEDGSVEGHIDILDNSQGQFDYDFTLALNDDADELAGVLEIKDADGAVAQSCDTRLDKTDVDN